MDKKEVLKGGKREDMKEFIIETKRYSEKCPICKLEIVNNSPESVKYNLKLHLEKHSKDAKIEK